MNELIREASVIWWFNELTMYILVDALNTRSEILIKQIAYTLNKVRFASPCSNHTTSMCWQPKKRWRLHQDTQLAFDDNQPANKLMSDLKTKCKCNRAHRQSIGNNHIRWSQVEHVIKSWHQNPHRILPQFKSLKTIHITSFRMGYIVKLLIRIHIKWEQWSNDGYRMKCCRWCF